MIQVPDSLRQRLATLGQEHVLAFWPALDDAGRQRLLSDLESIGLDELAALYALRDKPADVLAPEKIQPVECIPHNAPENGERKRQGEAALRCGEVAVLVVAGGQGSRLGFDQPKGMFPVGPVSGKTLFHFHGEKVLALRRRYACRVPYLVMTSPATHKETVAYFESQAFFGLPRDEVHFFCQAVMPALDLATGKLLLEATDRLFLSPDGHGGTLTALARSGLLARLQRDGIRQVFYFQVDNPLVKIADPVFLGHHVHASAEVSSKVVAKAGPLEKMGVFAMVGGRCRIVEYSDLPEALMRATDASGRLRLWAGNPAIHLFDVAFLERMTREPEHLAFHVARKKVPHVDAAGARVDPTRENALKFERFIFDVLPAAQRCLLVESLRAEEFAPLKNAEGADSPATVERALIEQAASWLEHAGGRVPRQGDGAPQHKLEVNPLFALDAEEFAAKVPGGTTITGPRCFA